MFVIQLLGLLLNDLMSPLDPGRGRTGGRRGSEICGQYSERVRRLLLHRHVVSAVLRLLRLHSNVAVHLGRGESLCTGVGRRRKPF